jgi:hypothetical protein
MPSATLNRGETTGFMRYLKRQARSLQTQIEDWQPNKKAEHTEREGEAPPESMIFGNALQARGSAGASPHPRTQSVTTRAFLKRSKLASFLSTGTRTSEDQSGTFMDAETPRHGHQCSTPLHNISLVAIVADVGVRVGGVTKNQGSGIGINSSGKSHETNEQRIRERHEPGCQVHD